jgi:Amt family ammonium transporter
MSGADTAWMLMATALVMLMTPGVAFFYGGMVPARSAVSTKFQSFACLGIVGLVWAVCGYSLVFSGGDGNALIGNLKHFMLEGVGQEPNPDFGKTIPHVLFMIFQATFAMITPALISGAVAERIRFKAWLVFAALWSLFVYVPVAHWVWGPGGWIGKLGGLDFAGGMVVHMTSGYAALVAALVLGNRAGFKPDAESNSFSTPMVLLGTALLWFGWFGFNAGSALAANGIAAQAAGTTMFAACASMVVWMICDWTMSGRPTSVGAAVGAVAGLVAITPAAGYVTLQAALIIGVVVALVCNFAARLVKHKLKTDDTVDVFACHGVGGTVGTILTAVFATTQVNAGGANGLLYGSTQLFVANVTGAVAVIAYTMMMTFVVLKVVNFFTPLRVTQEEEASGLDASQHGESVFIFN